MFSFSFAGSVRLILALALAGAGSTALRAQDAAAGNDKFRQGADLYFRGKSDEALKIFQEILAANPSNQEAFRLYQQCGKEVMALMLVKGGEFETTAKRFLELATLGRKEKTDDAAAIGALVEKVLTGSYLDARDAMYQLSADHGEYGAAPFIPNLAQEDNLDQRVKAIDALVHLAGDAVLPLCAACDSANDVLVRSAVSCLGAIGDARALPALKKVYESGASPVAKDAAAAAIRKISGKDAGALASAADLHIAAAADYFRSEQKVVKPFDTADAVWSSNGDAVVATKVPALLRSLRLAQQHCKAALDNPNSQAILLAAYAGEKAACVSAKEMGLEGAPDADASLDVMLASGGADGLSAALDFATKNDAPLAAVEIVKTLDAMGAMTPAVHAAAGSSYKIVRYHAAFALASHGDTGEAVMKVLGEAVGEDALRTVLVVDDKSESRNAAAAALRAAGYSVITAENGGTGFARARTIPPKDVILLRAGMADVTVDQFVYDADCRNSSSAIVLLAGGPAAETLKTQYEGKGKVKGFVADPVAAEAVTAAVKAAMPDLNHERASALAAAERAAGLLAHAPAASLASVKDALVKSLARTEEPVLGGVLAAVGHAGIGEAAAPVAAIFADASKSEAIRVAAANALGGIFSKMSTAPAEDVLKPVMDAAAGEANAAVRLAAGRALGSAAFMNAGQRGQLLKGATK